MSTIYVVDIVLLVILYILIMFMCGYSAFCVYRILRSMQMRILLRPTRVVFSHTKEGESTEELRTVVAYQNPFTGDYCVRKSRLGQQGYVNSLPGDSPDSGLSDEYEPLNLDSMVTVPRADDEGSEAVPQVEVARPHTSVRLTDNSVNKTWNWNYKEYQI